MRRSSVIYYSETGNTERAAGWIAEGAAAVAETEVRLFGQRSAQQAHRLFEKNKGKIKMVDETMLWEKAAAFHGHVCGGLTIGYKAALYAIQLLDIHFSEDEELICISENDACGVDAIQAILGCSVGKGNLLFHMTGKQAFSFYNRKTGKSVRLVLRPRPSMSREESFAYLQGKTPAELFDVKETRISLPERAHLFRSVSCAICGEETAEHFCRLMDGKTVCLDCADQYDRFRV